ncbi:MAG: hypothetical protein ACK5HR_05670 [Mycoplasmatales bacterium]
MKYHNQVITINASSLGIITAKIIKDYK